MLMSREELYNKITGSSAYNNKNAVLDSSKVNKGKYSPNNIKALLLGKNAAVVIYYTTNPTAPRLVRFIQLSQTYKNEEEYQEALKSKKGMIDVVEDGLKFSNLEEIFFFSEGFTPEEVEKESCRIDLFAKDINKIQRSFKRLKGIALVPKGIITKDFENHLKNDKFILPQLEKGKYSIIPIATNKPETDEYGLLKNFERDSVQYAYDAEYDPNTDAKERESEFCRLHKWYYDQIANAKRTQEKAKEETEKAQDTQKEEVEKAQTTQKEEVEIDKVAIEINLNRIMKVYKDLYSSCFGLKKPFGLLVKGGILTIKDGVTVVEKSQMYSDLYALTVASSDYDIKAIAQQEGISRDDLYKVPLNGTYFPLFHLAVLFGRTPNWVFKSWNKPETRKLKDGSIIKTTLENEISKLLRQKLEETVRNGGELNDISDKLCTSFVVAELAKAGNGAPLMFKIKFSAGNAKFNQDTFINTFMNGGDKYLAGDAKITPFKPKPTGVAKINLCLNEEVYQKMPLFGYEAVEHKKANGEMVGIENCIIGQTREDEILTINLKDDNNCKIINIMAGPRSGKGVLTQSLEGAILADGCPLIYMDAKPDMATVLNEVANKNGLRVAAWDLNTPPLEYLKDNANTLSEEVRTKLSTLGSAAPNLIRNKSGRSTWGLLAYLKMIQLTAVSAIMQLDGKITASGKGNAFFVLDELLRVMAELDVFNALVTNIEKDKEIDEINRNWAKNMRKWIEALGSELYGAAQSEIPKSNTNIICIYQEPTPFRDENTVTKVFRPYVRAKTTTRLVGGQGANLVIEGIKALQGDDKAGINLVSNYFHFAKFTGSSLTKGGANYEIFKPYLVLNDADPDGEYVTKMRDNIKEEAYADLVARGGGTVPKGVGFEGYMESIGDNGIQNLSKGYEYLTTLLEVTGLSRKYSCIEEYLYDADISSFYERNVLVEGRAGEVAEVNKLKSDVASSGSWNLDDESGTEEEINLFDSNNFKAESSPSSQPQQSVNTTQTQTGPKPQTQQAQSGQYQQQTAKPQTQQTSNPLSSNKAKTYQNAYTKQLDIPEGKNPFEHYRGDGAVSTLNQLKEMTKLILQDISSVIGGLDRVATFRVTEDGILIINETAYQPTFDTNFLESLPFSIQGKVSSGCVAELFDLSKLYQFKNLQSLIIDSQTLSQGRARRELGLRPRERYNVLFKVFRQLQYINAGGVEYRGFNPDEVVNDTRDTLKGYTFGERMKNLFAGSKQTQPQTYTSSPRMEAFWNSKPVRLTTNALGWTLGTKAVLMSAAIFGPWSLLFGALMLAGKYSDYKEKHPDKPKSRQNQKSGQNQGRYRDNYYDDYDDYDRQGRRPNNNGNYRNNHNSQSRSNNNRNNR